MLAGAALAMPASPAAAQLASPVGVRARAPVPRAAALDLTRVSGETPGLPGRLGLALLGGTVGGFSGAAIGYIIPTGGGEDPGLSGMVISAAIGAALGAVAFAALPEGASRCDYSERFGRGMLGAALVAPVGLVASGDARIITVSLGAVVGAALGAESCEWGRRR